VLNSHEISAGVHIADHDKEQPMDIPRMIGTGIAMIIPSFVACGLVWSLFQSWIPTFLCVAVMAVVTGSVMKKVASLESGH
jgi:hypothetical protein